MTSPATPPTRWDDALATRASAWLDDDPDDATRAELRALQLAATTGDDQARAELARRFSGRLQFGTAGLRGAMGAGPMRMNRVTVGRAAAGLAAWLRDHDGRCVVVGYDARTNSDVFARDTAQIMTGAGLSVQILPRPLPTPVLAFAIRESGADAGVMVTASHNPAIDNGYKVYLGNGSQIVPPVDGEIAARIDAVTRLSDVPRGAEWTTLDDIADQYLARAASLVPVDAPRDLVVVTTAMHGVGGALMSQALTASGFAAPHVVGEQQTPDPAFPTVSFPNPEEPGALDLALALASSVSADLVLANDPDADRCAAAIPTASGKWRPLTGDEVGGLLGEFVAQTMQTAGMTGTFATTIVSSTRLSRIADAHRLGYVETLTGFKWIGRVEGLAFGYEEAIGYCVDPAAVADKDGITAGLRLAQLAAQFKAKGHSLLDGLDDLDRTYGVHRTAQVSVRSDDAGALATRIATLINTPPAKLGDLAVQSVDDLSRDDGGLPPTEGVRLRLAGPTDDGSARVVVRPSGTEPKLKAYLEVVVPLAGQPLHAARKIADDTMTRLRADVAAHITD